MKKTSIFIITFSLLNVFFISAKPSDAEYKKRILAAADLGGQSFEELLSDSDNENDDYPEVKEIKSAEREVIYTTELQDFINNYFNNNISDETELLKYFNRAVAVGNNYYSDEYSRLVNLARCNYFYGMWLMSTFDVSDIDQLDLTDNSSSAALNNYAGEFYDKAIEFASTALELHNGSDAYSILGLTISANCTAKNTSYILANALKIKSYGKKALKSDPHNGGACFLVSAQDIYAPVPFCKLNKGRKQMSRYLSDLNLRKEKYEEFNISCAVAYSWYKKKKYQKAYECYIQCRELYPKNYSVNMMLQKLQEKLSK